MIKVKARVWVEKDGEIIFGRGRKELLKAIDELGSISEAARALNMSYRAAWGRIKASEKRAGVKLVNSAVGRGKRTTLTSIGRKWMEAFEVLEENLSDYLKVVEQKIPFE